MSETATTEIVREAQTNKRPPVTAEREAVIAMLKSEGMSTKVIAQTLGLSTGTVYNVNSRLKKNGNNPFLTPKRIKAATKVIDTFMRGERIGIIEEIDPETGEKTVIDPGIKPKCSTIKACADSVLDRAYPKAQEEGGKGNISFTQVNISLASGIASNPPIDVSPDPAPSLTGNNG